MSRTRWAAVGAAVAVSLGAGGVGLLQATAPEGAAAFVPITPCRLFDTRPAPHTVGTRTTPLGPDEIYDIAGHGAQGNCELPDAAVGLVLNVTAVDATQATFLTLFPTGAERPTASHLNPSPGAPPAPNAVTVDLSGEGEFSVFNRFGNVHVLADVVGFYTDHHHDDRYYTKSQADATRAQLEAATAQLAAATEQLAAALDTRVPSTDSITLAGGAFAAVNVPLEMASGTACFKPAASTGMSHTVPVTAGSTVTALGVRARSSSVSPQQFILTLYAQRPGTSDAVPVHVAQITIASAGLFESRVELPTPEHADPGESLFVTFTPLSSETWLCSADVEFTRPG
jgi:hypothetical protein